MLPSKHERWLSELTDVAAERQSQLEVHAVFARAQVYSHGAVLVGGLEHRTVVLEHAGPTRRRR